MERSNFGLCRSMKYVRALPWGGGGGGGATPAQIWSYASRTLTESAGLTTEQTEQLDRIYENADIKRHKSPSSRMNGYKLWHYQFTL